MQLFLLQKHKTTLVVKIRRKYDSKYRHTYVRKKYVTGLNLLEYKNECR